MAGAVPPGSTIADIICTLAHPEEYVRGVLGHLYECRRDYPTAYVRIGITGHGIVPHYRIEYPGYAGAPPGTFGAFRGDNHKRLVDEDLLRDEHWSTKMMSLEEVATLLGNLRKAKKSHADRT
jgi:hypothetical protein